MWSLLACLTLHLKSRLKFQRVTPCRCRKNYRMPNAMQQLQRLRHAYSVSPCHQMNLLKLALGSISVWLGIWVRLRSMRC
jgi:hypothetical protein